MLIGGLLQLLVLHILWTLERSDDHFNSQQPSVRKNLQIFKQHIFSRHAIRSAFTLAIATAFYRWKPLGNGYWVPMIAAIVIRPTLPDALKRGVKRILGTLSGALVATFVAETLHPNKIVLSLLVLSFAFGCYLLINSNYMMFALTITAYVVFLLSLVGLNELDIIKHRTLNTAFGGVLALAGYFIFDRLLARKSAAQSR